MFIIQSFLRINKAGDNYASPGERVRYKTIVNKFQIDYNQTNKCCKKVVLTP